MSLTYGPKKFDIAVPSASNVKVLNRADNTPATLSSPVSITADGSVTFTVANPGHYVVEIATSQVRITDKPFLTNADQYDITDPRSYANKGPAVAGGTSASPGTPGSPGAKGEKGDTGNTGPAGPANLHISTTAPPTTGGPKVWVQINGSGVPISLWLETGT